MTHVSVLLIILFAALLMAALWTVLAANLLMSAIGLAVCSLILTLALFLLDAPLAGVFELSVCAGLITVVFISAISLTRPLAADEERARVLSRLKRFFPLPILLLCAGAAILLMAPRLDVSLPPAALAADVRHEIWNFRRLDLVGHILVIMAGIFGVVQLFKERPGDKGGDAS